jgi:predicted phage-related endonuclease
MQFPDAVLEIKTSMSRTVADELGEDGTDTIPTDWLCQVQQQLDVVDLDEAFVAVLIFGRLRTYTVHRNADIGTAIRSAAVEMRDRILHRDPPPLDFAHEHTPELVRSLRGDTGPAVEIPEDVHSWWKIRQDYAAEIRDLEKWRSEATSRVEAWMVERGVGAGILPDGKRIVRREVSRKGYSVEPKTYTEVREVKA